ncbi:MAG TPA: extensin family protein [Stellaceae bacterium]|nr:extensin family protein [Stellaceae bacterium]
MRVKFYAICAVLPALLAACAVRPPPAPTGQQGEACLARLDAAGIAYAVAAMPAGGAACTVDTPVRVSAAGVAWNQPGVVSCAFALELDAFAREDLASLALQRFGQGVRLLRHRGTFACRRETSDGSRWSLHASGRAIDIAGFELADGSVIAVERDWRGGGAKSLFLHELARRACRRFSVVLTPDSDRDHRDHLHLDSGPWKLCGA